MLPATPLCSYIFCRFIIMIALFASCGLVCGLACRHGTCMVQEKGFFVMLFHNFYFLFYFLIYDILTQKALAQLTLLLELWNHWNYLYTHAVLWRHKKSNGCFGSCISRWFAVLLYGMLSMSWNPYFKFCIINDSNYVKMIHPWQTWSLGLRNWKDQP